jgi:hypothetical protein
MGLSTMGNISLGIALVAGNIRVPKPATGIIAFIISFLKTNSSIFKTQFNAYNGHCQLKIEYQQKNNP